jgi:formate-dependent nitrite reductase membrane component NrfD
MGPIIHFAPYTGWVFPNETVIEWTVLLAVYPYLTGLVAGAFTVSSLYQVFGFERFKPVAHVALLTSLCCMLFVPLPPLLHLGHPGRAFNALITPHLTSAMAMFGFFATFYVVLLMLEIWFAYRRYIVEQATEAQRPSGQGLQAAHARLVRRVRAVPTARPEVGLLAGRDRHPRRPRAARLRGLPVRLAEVP